MCRSRLLGSSPQKCGFRRLPPPTPLLPFLSNGSSVGRCGRRDGSRSYCWGFQEGPSCPSPLLPSFAWDADRMAGAVTAVSEHEATERKPPAEGGGAEGKGQRPSDHRASTCAAGSPPCPAECSHRLRETGNKTLNTGVLSGGDTVIKPRKETENGQVVLREWRRPLSPA